MQYNEIISKLKSERNPKNIEGMKRFGISTKNTLGVSVVRLRKLAKEIGTNHETSVRLWESGIHEARILASMVDDPTKVTEAQLERWVKGFDSWDVCDQCCSNLFSRTDYAYKKVYQWSKQDSEFVKRAGYALIAALTVHDKEANDKRFADFLPLIKRGAVDERNFVKKSVNWALRQIGKRNKALNKIAIKTAKEIKLMDSKSAKWIASDALRELEGKAVQERLSK